MFTARASAGKTARAVGNVKTIAARAAAYTGPTNCKRRDSTDGSRPSRNFFAGTIAGFDGSNLVECSDMAPEVDFEKLVELHYKSLYRFAFSLTRNESEASDLTQQSFYIFAKSGGQLRDKSKVKSWLFTTLHREYLARRRRIVRFPETNFSEAEPELPPVETNFARADAPAVLGALSKVDPTFQAAVALFYLEDYSYPQIAEILDVPLGTVKSRIARGIEQLKRLLLEAPARRPA